ncbi:MAG: hypothetical protein B7Y31_12715 [Novosphingobium sp. 16-62-11]|nr:MAG: hypothetical protein B7Y31_12715 [Novosphingobium sp. 16-62-11]
MATAVNDVYNFEMQIIELEKAARVTDLNTRVKMGELSQAEFEAQRGLVSELAQAQTLRALRNKQEAETAALERDQRDDLQTLAALSNTTTNRRERVDIEKRILDLQYQIERARLDEAIAAGQIADAAKARANLEARQAADTAALNRDSAGPLGQYIEGLRQSRENVGDEVQALVVDELNQVRDGIRGAIEDRLGVKDPPAKWCA